MASNAPKLAAVVADEPLVLRSAPGIDSPSIVLEERLHPGMRVVLVEGPIVASGYSWYRIAMGDREGWAAAASREGEPWLALVRNGDVAISREAASDGEIHPQVFLIGDDGEQRQLTDLTAADVDEAVSSSSTIVPVLTCGYGIYPGGWASSGEHLVASVGGCDTAVFAIEAASGSVHWLGGARSPVWSPDGTRVAHAANYPYLPEASGRWEISLWEVESGRDIPVTRSPELFAAGEPAWSPDGAFLAYTGGFVGDFTSSPSIFVVRSDGTEGRELTDGFSPQWSADGSTIVFVRPLSSGEAETWAMNPDGSNARRIAAGPGAALSPDGRWVATRNQDNVQLVELAGDNPVDLGPGVPQGWSPDGRAVVIARYAGENVTLVAIDLYDGSERTIGQFELREGGFWSYLGWQPRYQPLDE